MKTNEAGHYYLKAVRSGQLQLKLTDKNLVAFQGSFFGELDPAVSVTKHDVVLLIRFLGDTIELCYVHSARPLPNETLVIGKTFSVNGMDMVVEYSCHDDKLYDVIKEFKEGTLTGPVNIKLLLLQYARKKRITEKQAVCHIVTTIDVPEVDARDEEV
jgi:hypothetical protein